MFWGKKIRNEASYNLTIVFFSGTFIDRLNSAINDHQADAKLPQFKRKGVNNNPLPKLLQGQPAKETILYYGWS
jgi:hypothetical protein